MRITDWPLSERPREKLLHQGADALSDAELLAIFLRTGIRGLTAVDLARQLLAHFGSLRSMFGAPEFEFCRAKGLGQAKYVQLQAVLELARRHLHEEVALSCVADSTRTVKHYVQSKFADFDREHFGVLFLDTQYRLIVDEVLFQGTLASAAVYPREVVKRGLALNAAALILVHNHPSGVAEPSDEDIHMTKQISEAAILVDMKVLDHMVVGKDSVVSFAERGLL